MISRNELSITISTLWSVRWFAVMLFNDIFKAKNTIYSKKLCGISSFSSIVCCCFILFDSIGFQAVCSVVVTVEDVNDVTPSLLPLSPVLIPLDIPPGTLLTQALATDGDATSPYNKVSTLPVGAEMLVILS